MCGATSQQKQLANSQQAFFQNLTASYQQNFGEQQGILSALTNTLSPIFEAGPNQMGFSASENAALTGSAINNAAAINRHEQVIAASSAGGNTGVTTGGQKQLQAGIAASTGNQLSSNLNQIQLENARTGRANFLAAESGLAGVAGMENPIGYGGVANSAGENAMKSAEAVQEANDQWVGALGGLAGSALSGWASGGFKTGGGSSSGGGGSMAGQGWDLGSDVG